MKKRIHTVPGLSVLLMSVMSLFMMTACTEGFSRGSKQQKDSTSAGSSGAKSSTASSGDWVWIKRTDGGISCEQDKAQTVEAGEAELKKSGINVKEARKGSDGQMHVQMCGAPTGPENRYLIPKSEVEKARAMGFSLTQP